MTKTEYCDYSVILLNSSMMNCNFELAFDGDSHVNINEKNILFVFD